jgi:GNAT superfamily N-acetyltransferase
VSGITIRLAERQDLKGILAVFAHDDLGGHRETNDPAPFHVYEAAFDRLVSDPNTALFVAESANEIVGTFQLQFMHGLIDHGATKAKIESVHVLERLRGQGVGKQMLAYAMAEAKRRGAVKMSLDSNKKRLRAHKFYRDLGFDQSHEAFRITL